MAYTAITDTEIQPGKPGSNSLFTRLRDNAIAMITGLSGAPKILDAAFNTNSINANKLVNTSVGTTQLANNSVNFASKINSTVYDTTLSVSLAGTIIPAGVWNLQAGTKIEIWCASAGWQSIGGVSGAHQVISDGVSVRLKDGVAYSTPARRIFV